MKLVTYDRLHIDSLIRKRDHETKLGECVDALPWGVNENFGEHLSRSSSRYVLLGLPEDIGVRANFGRGGAYSAWQPVLNTLLNTQSNCYLNGSEILVLGHIDFSEQMKTARDFDFHSKPDINKARDMVALIDEAVVKVIRTIVESGKEPVIIGG